jgi:hypothetical protein
MKKITLLLICLIGNFVFSHTINYENVVLRHWSIEKEHKFIEGSFMMYKNGVVFIEDANNAISKVAFSDLSNEDQKFVTSKNSWVKNLNTIAPEKKESTQSILDYKFWLILLSLIAFGYYIFTISDRKKLKFLYPVLFLGILTSLYSFTKKAMSTTDPAFLTSAFVQFASTVSTTYDANFFYVNSTGIPNHTMMVGISNHGWQQQVPTSKCYINASHWTIPLNPVIATTPVPVSSTHFLKGAIAMAVNGVPIFNYHTNTGVDSFTDGQLDNYGGHCGRGDDYHYHIAPLHLITLGQASATLPIAFGLDGYAVYGNLEPDGTAMTTLDANHGHYGTNGVYHYHGTASAPYMIGNMVGVVTEDANLQIIPQPQGNPIRTENWTPLAGALITSCVANANNGYNTAYTLNGISGYATNYTATAAGLYTFQYVTPTGTTSTNYNGPAQCTVPNLGFDEVAFLDNAFTIYPNPTSDVLNIKLRKDINEKDILGVSIYDLKGSLVSKTSDFKSNIDIKNLSKGSYVVKIEFLNYLISKKIIVK